MWSEAPDWHQLLTCFLDEGRASPLAAGVAERRPAGRKRLLHWLPGGGAKARALPVQTGCNRSSLTWETAGWS